jgi:thiol-disulfide isomerase/thioredoxin
MTQDIVSNEQDFVSLTKNQRSLVHFYANWSEPCTHIRELFSDLTLKFPSLKFIGVEAEELPDLSVKFNISSVPTVLFMVDGKEWKRLEGPKPREMLALAEQLAEQSLPDLQTRLLTLIKSHPIMLFMKGSPTVPRCGFSRQTIELLNSLNVSFGTFDILTDESVRQGKIV